MVSPGVGLFEMPRVFWDNNVTVQCSGEHKKVQGIYLLYDTDNAGDADEYLPLKRKGQNKIERRKRPSGENSIYTHYGI